MPTIRLLQESDAAPLRAFLREHIETSTLLLSNLEAAGVRDRGQPFEATYAGSVTGDRILAIAAHCWNGTLLLQAPVHLPEVVRLATSHTGRPVRGLQGPWSQVVAARAALGLEDMPAPTDCCDVLYALELNDLRAPVQREGLASASSASTHDPLLVEWRLAFLREALSVPESPELRARTVEEMREGREADRIRVLTDHGRPVAMLTFIGRLPELIHIGGVWVPPEERGRGYARALFALSLEPERRIGIRRALLSADPANPTARGLYEGLGFRAIGDYGFVIFDSTA
jgi:ribosomal protein S18 acetylase RimI-like enzyme